MHHIQHKKKMKRRKHLLRVIKRAFPVLPEGAKIRLNNTATKATMAVHYPVDRRSSALNELASELVLERRGGVTGTRVPRR